MSPRFLDALRGRTSGARSAPLPDPGRRPLALVYRGPASLPGCPEAVAELLAAGPWDLDVRYTGPREEVPLTAEALSRALVYAQPGGGSLDPAYRRLRREAEVIRGYVHGGGRYLGFCLGGYLAGFDPGLGMLPGDTDQYITTPGATVDHEKDTVVDVVWRGQPRTVFFQDGPHFILDAGADAKVLATYPNGTVAALVTSFGTGRLGVVGPHPEATDEWFTDARLPVQRTRDLGLDLAAAVLDD
ncbi:BPL-N domain-containing protein [Streptomyces sp. NPDC049577]|uniref:BPL-N domain-containing protein n=1 Tax=Streptomyces sp. NPDC049577 TaxID=3155153 RepID=UPI00342A153A